MTRPDFNAIAGAICGMPLVEENFEAAAKRAAFRLAAEEMRRARQPIPSTPGPELKAVLQASLDREGK